jgi:hypothetical protein
MIGRDKKFMYIIAQKGPVGYLLKKFLFARGVVDLNRKRKKFLDGLRKTGQPVLLFAPFIRKGGCMWEGRQKG